MRITFVLPHAGLSGGIRVCAIYAQALMNRGHDVFVVSTPPPPKNRSLKSRVKRLLKGQGWTSQVGKEPGHFDNLKVPHKVIEKWRPIVDADVPDADVVVATWWETAEWVNALAASKGRKAYFIQGDERFIHMPHDRVEATWKLPLFRITISQWLVDLGRNYYGVDQVECVPNGVDPKQFHAPVRGKQKTPRVGMLYSPSPVKGCDIAFEAFRIAERNVAQLQLVLFGQHKPTEEVPLPKGTEFHHRPAQDKIKDIYASCDAWLFASRSDGFGLPILEAFACRTPVIAVPMGASPELLKPGGGLMVKPQDPIDMARAIERVCRLSNDDWKQMSEIAYQTAQRNTWERCCEMFEAALVKASRS